MGIYDRDYIRERRGTSGGGPGPRFARLAMWSMTTWIILICCGVFLFDSYISPRSWWKPVEIAREISIDAPPKNWQWLRNPNELHNLNARHPLPFERFIVDTDSREVVGRSTFAWMPPLQRWLYFSTDRALIQILPGGQIVGLEFWRFIGFQFLHANSIHLIVNMIGLFFFGPLVESYLGKKRFLAFYLLCGIFGALMYLLLNLSGFVVTLLVQEPVRIPGLLFHDPRVPLVGASAGVFGVLMAGAYLRPRDRVYLFFVFPLELRPLAYILVAVAVISLLTGGANAGGEAGHLGGALAGFYFIRRPHHLHGFFDFLGRVDPTSHHYRKSKARTTTPSRGRPEAEIDRILAKIHASGMASLTERERDILRQASRREG